MKKKFEYITMLIFLGVIFFYFMCFGVGIVKQEILPKVLDLKSAEIIETDWSIQYPFAEEKNEDTQTNTDKINIFVKIENAIIKVKSSVEYHLNQNFIFNRELIELNGKVNHLLGKHIVTGMESTVFQLMNGYLAQADESMTKSDYKYSIQQVEDFARYVEKKNIPFLYVQMPNKVCKFDPELPIGIEFKLNDQMDETVEKLRAKNYEVLDFRKLIHEENLNHYDLFYKTDHHWKVETAFWAAQELDKVLRSDEIGLVADQDNLNRVNFYEQTYKKSFLGYLGRQVTLGYAKPEDFNLLLPKYNLDYELKCPEKNLELTGDFEKCLINWDMYDEDKSVYDKSYYDGLLYGNQAVMTIKNNSVNNKSKVLIIKDSFSLPMAMYLSTAYHEVTLIDIRLNQGKFNGSVRSFIDEYQPDAVVLGLLPTADVVDRLR